MSWGCGFARAACLNLAITVAVPVSAQPATFDIAVDNSEPVFDRIVETVPAALGARVAFKQVVLPRPKSKSVAEVQAFQAVRQGKAALALVPMRSLERFSSFYAYDQIPFFDVPNPGVAPKRLADIARPLLEKRLAEDGLLLLAILPLPVASFWLGADGNAIGARCDRPFVGHLVGYRRENPD